MHEYRLTVAIHIPLSALIWSNYKNTNFILKKSSASFSVTRTGKRFAFFEFDFDRLINSWTIKLTVNYLQQKFMFQSCKDTINYEMNRMNRKWSNIPYSPRSFIFTLNLAWQPNFFEVYVIEKFEIWKFYCWNFCAEIFFCIF